MLEFGRFSFDQETHELRAEGVPVPLPPRCAALLACLLDRPGQLVTKDTIIAEVWQSAYVMDHSLAEAVRVLRSELGDDARTPKFIATVPRRGYRFVAEVRETPPTTLPTGPTPELPSSSRPARLESRVGLEAGRSLLRMPPLRILAPPTLLVGAVVASIVGSGAVGGQGGLGGVSVAVTLASELPMNLESDMTVRLSEDGSEMIYRSGNRGWDGGRLYRRAISSHGAEAIPGSENALQPEVSPDGAYLVAFVPEGDMEDWSYWLRTIPLGEGTPTAIVKTGVPFGADWIDDRRIVYAAMQHEGEPGPERRVVQGTWVVSIDEGVPRPLTVPDVEAGEYMHVWPHVLPGGRQALITIVPDMAGPRTEDSSVALVDLATGQRRTLISGGAFGRYAGSGHVVFARANQIFAVPFDLAAGRRLGQARRLLEDVATFGVEGAAAFDASRRHLVYLRGPSPRVEPRLARLDAGGDAPTWVETPAADYLGSVAISADSRFWAWARQSGGDSSLILDVLDTVTAARTPTRLPGPFADFRFDTDRSLIVAHTDAQMQWGLRRQRLDGSQTETLIEPEHPVIQVTDRLADGTLLLTRWGGATRYDLWRLPPQGEWEPYLAGPMPEVCARLSPDARWLAYASREEGTWHVFVSPYPSLDGRTRVSARAASSPAWSHDGRALFMSSVSEDGRSSESILRQPFSPASGLPDGPREEIVTSPHAFATGAHLCRFAVAPDDSYFLAPVGVPNRGALTTEVHLLVDWAAGIR